MRKCIFAAAAAVAVLLSDIGGTAVYAGENVPYETYNYDYYEAVRRSPQLPIIWMPPNLLGTFHQ